jgi:AcrR family transcriptional regulator
MNTVSTQTRRYELKARAERQEETRRRIVEATEQLHEEVGPARTTVAEIARRAGVQRLTVYNHFPDEAELFAACSKSYMSAHPFPDLDDAFALEDPSERVHVVLRRVYARYRETEPMIGKIQRDRLLMPALDAQASHSIDARMAELSSGLASGFPARGRGRKPLQATLRLALDFWTWRRLDREGLDDSAAAKLMADLVAASAAR